MALSPVHSPVRTFPLRVSASPSNGLAAVLFSGGPVSGGRLGSRLPFLLLKLNLFGLHP
jgi:hypothetical protein